MEDFDDLNPEPDENGAVDMSQQVRRALGRSGHRPDFKIFPLSVARERAIKTWPLYSRLQRNLLLFSRVLASILSR